MIIANFLMVIMYNELGHALQALWPDIKMAICFDLSLQNSKAIIHKLCNASRGRGLALMLRYGKDGEINALFGIEKWVKF